MTTAVIVGGTGGLGLHIAESLAWGSDRVFLTSRDAERAAKAAAELGSHVTGLAVDLSRPATVEEALGGIDRVDHLVITALQESTISLDSFDIDSAVRTATIKLVGYAEVVRSLRARLADDASVVLFGGMAKDRPYPGSTMVTTSNSALSGLVRTLAVELAPVRVNALHPGVVGDSPRWLGKTHPHEARTPIGRTVRMQEVSDAVQFLLRNGGVNATDLHIDGGLSAC